MPEVSSCRRKTQIVRLVAFGFAHTSYLSPISPIYLWRKTAMWRNFRFLNVTDAEESEVSPQVEQFQIYPHNRGGEILNFSTYDMCVMCKIDALLL